MAARPGKTLTLPSVSARKRSSEAVRRGARAPASAMRGSQVQRPLAQEQTPQRLPPEPAEDRGIAHGARDEAQVVAFQDLFELRFAVVARGGGAVAVFHHRAGRVDGGPAALPGPVAQVEILHVGRLVDLVHVAERGQFRGVVERAAAAAVQDPGAVLAGERFVAAHREVFGGGLGEDRLAGLFAALAGGEADLRGGAEKVGDLVERPAKRGEEAGLDLHVVIQQADMGVAGARDAEIDCPGEGERGAGVLNFDGGVAAASHAAVSSVEPLSTTTICSGLFGGDGREDGIPAGPFRCGLGSRL